MKNKIPKEIKRRKGKSFAIINKIRENEFYKMGFKAGQKQTNEEELKFLKTLTFPRSNIYIFSSIKSRIQELKTKLTEKEKRQELFSDIWDNKEDDRWDKDYNPDLLPKTFKNKEKEKQDE